MDDNGIYMSRGKVVNGESVGVGRVSSSVVESIESKILNSAGSEAKMTGKKSGGNRARRSVVVETKGGEDAVLTEYLRPGGGHHIHMKSAYKSHPLYNLNEALCLSHEEMRKLGIDHQTVTNAQRRMCIELRKSGGVLTREIHNDIQVKALVEGGATEQMARSIVAASLKDLKRVGVRQPTDMPYAPKGSKK